MKIFCYKGKDDWYLMPDSSILRTGQPFFIPDFDDKFVIIPVLMARIGKLGKSILPKYVDRYVDGISLGGIVYASTLLTSQQQKGLPYGPATCFDKSLFLSKTVNKGILDSNTVLIDGREYRFEDSDEKLTEAVCDLSRYNTLKDGDLIIFNFAEMRINPIAGNNFNIDLKDNNNNTITQLLEIHIR